MKKTSKKLSVKLGHNVATLRKGKQQTQKQLADKIGVHSTRVSDIENGRSDVRLSTVERYAKALGATPEELLQ